MSWGASGGHQACLAARPHNPPLAGATTAGVTTSGVTTGAATSASSFSSSSREPTVPVPLPLDSSSSSSSSAGDMGRHAPMGSGGEARLMSTPFLAGGKGPLVAHYQRNIQEGLVTFRRGATDIHKIKNGFDKSISLHIYWPPGYKPNILG